MISMRIEGQKELVKALGALPRATARASGRRILKRAGQIMADMAIRLAPDDPKTADRDIKNSIAVATRAKRGRIGPGEVGVYIGVATSIRRYVHAIVMEFGSSKDAAQPYMRPAWMATKGQMLDFIGREFFAEVMKTVAAHAKRAARRK